jgi:hypothetical protein
MSVYPSCSACAVHASHKTRVRDAEAGRPGSSATPVVAEEKENNFMDQPDRGKRRP